MSEEKMDQSVAEDTGRNFLKKAVIIFSIIEALVMILGIVYKRLH